MTDFPNLSLANVRTQMTMPYDKGETEPGQDMHVDLLITLQTSEHCSLRFD